MEKAKLKETEAAAKIKVNEYEANVDAEYDAEVKTIEEKYAPLLAENAGNKEELNRINSEIWYIDIKNSKTAVL